MRGVRRFFGLRPTLFPVLQPLLPVPYTRTRPAEDRRELQGSVRGLRPPGHVPLQQRACYFKDKLGTGPCPAISV